MSKLTNVDGQFFPAAHPGWGAFAEELFHYTSRYYKTTEAFLCSLSGDATFSMSGYKASRLGSGQRALLAAVLARHPDREGAIAITGLVRDVCDGQDRVDAGMVERYVTSDAAPLPEHLEPVVHFSPEGENEVDPLDPFLSLADRLLLPVAVHDRHVEVSLRELAKHLQSANSTLRTNLHNAVIVLHKGGYVLRNHPHLMHCEVRPASPKRRE